jgi:hypothetical protein
MGVGEIPGDVAVERGRAVHGIDVEVFLSSAWTSAR